MVDRVSDATVYCAQDGDVASDLVDGEDRVQRGQVIGPTYGSLIGDVDRLINGDGEIGCHVQKIHSEGWIGDQEFEVIVSKCNAEIEDDGRDGVDHGICRDSDLSDRPSVDKAGRVGEWVTFNGSKQSGRRWIEHDIRGRREGAYWWRRLI